MRPGFNKKTILGAVGFILAISLIVGLYLILNSDSEDSTILINKVPNDSTVFIDGKEVKSKNISLENGTYQVSAKRDGFTDFNQNLTVNDFTKYIAITLLADEESEEAREWVRKNNQQYLDQERLLGSIEGKSGAEFLEINPITQKLPINNYTYDVGYKLNQSDTSGRSIVITIHADDGYRNAGIGSIYNIGYDPADLDIEFNNYTNPFEVKNEQ